MSVRNYHYSPRNNPEEGSSQLFAAEAWNHAQTAILFGAFSQLKLVFIWREANDTCFFSKLVFCFARFSCCPVAGFQSKPYQGDKCVVHIRVTLHLPIFRPNQFTSGGHFCMYLSNHPSFPSCCVVCFCFLPYFISTTYSCTCLLSVTRLVMNEDSELPFSIRVQKMSTYTDNYKWQNHTSPKDREIPWHDNGCQATLEGTCQEKTWRAGTKIQENVLAHGKKIGPVDTQ